MMAQAEVPCIRSSFEGVIPDLELVASSHDEDDDEYIPESLRLFVAQAEMKQESVLSLISNEMSGEEIEKTISEDFEATIIDLPPPSVSASSGSHSYEIEESPDPRCGDAAKPKPKARMSKRIVASDNASHFRRLLGSSASKSKQVLQRPTRRRPLTNHADIVVGKSSRPLHRHTFQQETSPTSSGILPVNHFSSQSNDGVTPPADLSADTQSENSGLLMPSFDEEEEVPESLRFLFEQADQALRQTQQEFLDVARGCYDPPALPKVARGANLSAPENKNTSPSPCDDKSVEFPLSLYTVGTVSEGSDAEAPRTIAEVEQSHESIDGSGAQFAGAQRTSSMDPEIEFEPILVQVSWFSSRTHVQSMEPLEPEPILMPLTRCETGEHLDEDTRKRSCTASLEDILRVKREWDDTNCAIVSAPMDRVDSLLDDCRKTQTESTVVSPPSSAARSYSRAPVEMMPKSVNASPTRPCTEAGYLIVEVAEQVPQILPDHDFESREALEGSSTRNHLILSESILVQEDHACSVKSPETDSLSIAVHRDHNDSRNAASSLVATGQLPSPSQIHHSASKSVVTRECEEARSWSADCDALQSTAGLVHSELEVETQEASHSVSKLDDRSFDGSRDVVEGENPTGRSSPLVLTQSLTHNVAQNDQSTAGSPVLGDRDTYCERSVNDTTHSTKCTENGGNASSCPVSTLSSHLLAEPQEPEPHQIFDVTGEVVQSTVLPLSGMLGDTPVRFSPCPSDDNQSANYIPLCCSPAQASSKGTKGRLPGAQESGSEESSIRNPPSIVQVPPPTHQQLLNSPDLTPHVTPCIGNANATFTDATGRATVPCGEFTTDDRVSSTLTESFSDDSQSIHDESKNCPHAQRLTKPIRDEIEGEALNQQDRGPMSCGEAGLQPRETISSPAGAQASTSRDDSPLFGAFKIPEPILSFVALADELIEQQQSRFLCCGQDQIVSATSDEHVQSNSLDGAASSSMMKGEHSLRRDDSIWKIFTGSGSTDPIPTIPVEAVLESSRRGKSIGQNTRTMDTVTCIGVETGSLDKGSSEIVEPRKQTGECIDDARTASGIDIPLDERMSHLDYPNDKVVVATESASLARQSSCLSRSKESHLSELLPPRCEPSFDSRGVQSLESSHSWTKSAVEEHCSAHSMDALDLKFDTKCESIELTVSVLNSPGIDSSAKSAEETIASQPRSKWHDIGELGEEVFERCDDERSVHRQLSFKGEAPQGLENSSILHEVVSGLSRCTDERDLTLVTRLKCHSAATSNDVGTRTDCFAAPTLSLDIASLHAGEEIAGKIDESDHSPSLVLKLNLPSDHNRIQRTTTIHSESVSNDVERTTGRLAAADDPAVSSDPECSQPSRQDACRSPAAGSVEFAGKIGESDRRPSLDLELILPSDHDRIQSTSTIHSESVSNEVECTTGRVAAADGPVVASDPECSQPRREDPCRSPAAESVESRINSEKSFSDLVDTAPKMKRQATHSPRNWRSSNQKRAEEARAKAIERIRQRKLKEKQSVVVDSKETGAMELKAKRQQYSAKEGVARAIQRMKAFRKEEQANAPEQKIASETNSRRNEGSSGSRIRCLLASRVDNSGRNAPMIDKTTCKESTRTECEDGRGQEVSKTDENARCNCKSRTRERPRRSFIPAPRASRYRMSCPRESDKSTRMSRKLMAARSLDDLQYEPGSMGENKETVDLQSAMSFPSYMRPTKSSISPAYRRTDKKAWLLTAGDVPLASSSRLLQSMLRSEHPVPMNSGLWKWYARPLPPRAQSTRRN